jgi:glutamate-1-semialdehyde 2,1-aminomutase
VTEVPRFFTHADGVWHYDVDGNRMLDYTLAWGPLILGSNHPAINKAVIDAVPKGYGFGAGHAAEVALAKKLTEIIPGVEQCIFSNTGSEAVQAALRLARAKTGRAKVGPCRR